MATEEVIKNWGYTVTTKKVPPQGTNVKEVISRSVPERYHLSQNYPNPFNAETTIRFDLPKSSSLSLIIYDITGRKIKTLVNQNLLAGSHQIKWHGKDEYGRNVTSGVYVYKMTSQEMSFTKKALLIK